jgi:hypothetical protein
LVSTKRRCMVLELDMSIRMIDLADQDVEELQEIVGGHFDVTSLIRTPKLYVGIAVNDTGLLQTPQLPLNRLASSLRGVFQMQDTPLVGPAVLLAADAEGVGIPLPQEWIDMVQAIRRVAISLK